MGTGADGGGGSDALLGQHKSELVRCIGEIRVNFDEVFKPLAGAVIIPKGDILQRQGILVGCLASYQGGLVVGALVDGRVVSRKSTAAGDQCQDQHGQEMPTRSTCVCLWGGLRRRSGISGGRFMPSSPDHGGLGFTEHCLCLNLGEMLLTMVRWLVCLVSPSSAETGMGWVTPVSAV